MDATDKKPDPTVEPKPPDGTQPIRSNDQPTDNTDPIRSNEDSE